MHMSFRVKEGAMSSSVKADAFPNVHFSYIKPFRAAISDTSVAAFNYRMDLQIAF